MMEYYILKVIKFFMIRMVLLLRLPIRLVLCGEKMMIFTMIVIMCYIRLILKLKKQISLWINHIEY